MAAPGVKVDKDNPNDKWFIEAMKNTPVLTEGTYEAIGPHFNGNPYYMLRDLLELHGIEKVTVKRDFDSIKEWLETHNEEGLVFWLNGEPVCKIKRTDFSLKWPMKEITNES